MTPADGLGVGEVGYIITGVKDVRQSKVGDTITTLNKGATEALGGYKDPKPMVFSGLYPLDGSDYPSCATRSTSCSSTMPRSSTSRRPPPRSASVSASVSSGCCTST